MEEGAQTFRELVAWQLCEELKERVLKILERPNASRDFGWCDQIRKSARSAPALISEGFGRFRPKENAKYVLWAKGEVNETRNHLRDGLEARYMTPEEYRDLYGLTRRALKICGRYHGYLLSERAQRNADRLLARLKQQSEAVKPEPEPEPEPPVQNPEPSVQNPEPSVQNPEPPVQNPSVQNPDVQNPSVQNPVSSRER